MLKVPNTTETQRQYARRQLYDLAHVLEHLDTEKWDDLGERAALLRSLECWANVLYSLANHIGEVGTFSAHKLPDILRSELMDAWQGEGNSSRVSFADWLFAMAQNEQGTLRDAARDYLAIAWAPI